MRARTTQFATVYVRQFTNGFCEWWITTTSDGGKSDLFDEGASSDIATARPLIVESVDSLLAGDKFSTA